jgi:hypothetical protein
MEQGKFQARVRLITGELVRFLRQYSTPPQLDTDELELERVRLLAEDINSEIPSDLPEEGIRDRLMAMFSELRKTYKAHQWPASAHFIEAMDRANRRRIDQRKSLPSSPKIEAKVEIGADDPKWADRIKALDRNGIPESYIWGVAFSRCVRKGLLSESDVAPYRKSAMYNHTQLYGEQKTDLMMDDKKLWALMSEKDEQPTEARKAAMVQEVDKLLGRLSYGAR